MNSRRRPVGFRSLLFGLAALGVQACTPTPSTTEDAAGVVGRFEGGEIFLAEVEARVQRDLAAQAPATGETPIRDRQEWIKELTQATNHLAFERLIVPEQDLETLPELADFAPAIRRESTVDLYLEVEQATAYPTNAEIESFYQKNPEMFEQEGRRFVWHIFRRHRDGEPSGAAADFLRQLTQRIAAGETFRSLATRYSDSETRQLEGRLGWIVKGRLPQALENVVFALAPGQLSEPVEIPGGAVLFFVTDAFYAKSYSLEDARFHIATRLEQLARAKTLEELAAVPIPEDAMVLSAEELRSGLQNFSSDQVILQIDDLEYRLSQWVEDVSNEAQLELPLVEGKDRALEIYEERKNRYLAFKRAQEEGFATQDPLLERLQSSIDTQLNAQLVTLRSRDKMLDLVDQHPDVLVDFYRQNDHLFQSSLRLEVVPLEVALGTNPAAQMAALETLRDRLSSGDITMEQAADEIGGELAEPQWLNARTLQALEPKVRIYLLEIEGTGYSVPFQLDRKLTLVWVRSRDEPRILPYDEVKDRVRQEYFERHRQSLFQQLQRETLAEHNFKLNEDALLELLAEPTAE